jgi:hypothetical protein
MEQKKKVVKKVREKLPEFEHIVAPYGPDNVDKAYIHQLLESSNLPTYKISKTADKWVLPNRAKFTNFVDRTFKYNHDEAAPKADCTSVKADSVSLFPYQQFIKDYMQFASPYRGLLLYHGLGTGKSCSSIAAAEILGNHMNVVIMVPASLRDNYLNEIKKCGRRYFNTKQKWIYFPLDSIDNDILTKAGVSRAIAEKNGGLWIPSADGKPNFDGMSSDVKAMILEQIDYVIGQSFEFINYNGLKRASVEALVKKANGNPFDGKCVIVDEIHNFISTVNNNSEIGKAMYKLMMTSKNSKFILLSGTPLINYPHEIAILINLITGPRKIYELKAKKDSGFDITAIKEILNSNKYIDSYEIDLNGRKITVSFLPEGFAHDGSNPLYVSRESYVRNKDDVYHMMTDEQRISNIIKDLKAVDVDISLKWSGKEVMTLPPKEEDFNEYFVDLDNIAVKNKIMFMRRILGTVSYYSTYSEELYPSVSTEEVALDMTDYQFNKYEKARGEERLKEKRQNKGRGGQDSLFGKVGQVYRFYSRALCNFVFPEGIERPFPSKMSQIKKEVDMIADDDTKGGEDEEEDEEEKKVGKSDPVSDKDISKKYAQLLATAMEKLQGSGALDANEIGKYSPKFKYIYDKIVAQKGTALIYSQFRTVEGLGIFGKCLEANGFAEFKIKSNGGNWEVDIDEADYAKPKYITFTGSNEETRMLLRIFNSDVDNLPLGIKDKLPLLGGTNNIRGELIKVLMITKSGAEGISLKNVREVHVVEPYWNHIRVDQVIGRAVRTCSHIDLPKAERNVKVYIYCMKPTKKQLDNSFSVRSSDKAMTSDQHIYMMAKKKATIINQFLDLMKKASVDCAINAKHHDNLRCFSFPVNIDENKFVYKLNIISDDLDEQYKRDIVQNEWKGQVMITKKGSFLIRGETNEVYDYDLYVESGRLVKIGVLTQAKSTNKRVIKQA